MNDTDRAARQVQIKLLRQAGPRRRANMASNLTRTALARARRGIALAHPDLSRVERDLLFVRVHYGSHLARRLRTWLESRRLGE